MAKHVADLVLTVRMDGQKTGDSIKLSLNDDISASGVQEMLLGLGYAAHDYMLTQLVGPDWRTFVQEEEPLAVYRHVEAPEEVPED